MDELHDPTFGLHLPKFTLPKISLPKIKIARPEAPFMEPAPEARERWAVREAKARGRADVLAARQAPASADRQEQIRQARRAAQASVATAQAARFAPSGTEVPAAGRGGRVETEGELSLPAPGEYTGRTSGWKYQLNPDNSITILGAPAESVGSIGKVFRSGEAYDSIMGQIQRNDVYGLLYRSTGWLEPASLGDRGAILARSGNSGYRGARPTFSGDDLPDPAFGASLIAGPVRYDGDTWGAVALGMGLIGLVALSKW